MAIALRDPQEASVADSPRVSSSDQGPRLHLTYLDGLRGLAALYVLLHHCWTTQNGESFRSGAHGLLTNWLLYGHFAVDVFIVLSGFCLMLPVARRGVLSGGARVFIIRRAWRILPTFWAALILSCVLDLITRHLDPGGMKFGLGEKAFAANALMLTENIPSLNTINAAFWSVALEWKIYFLFPLFVLAWRRYGVAASLGLMALLGYGIFGLLRGVYPGGLLNQPGADGIVGVQCPWYVFLFGLGAAAAALAYGPRPVRSLGVNWTILVLGCVVGVGVLIHFHPSGDMAYTADWPWTDPLVGVLAAWGLLMLAVQNRGDDRTRLHAALSWRPLVSLGKFSYSLYLMHIPLLWLFIAFFHQAVHHGVSVHLARRCLAVFGVPLIVAAAYGFSLVFERPFLDASLRERVLARLWGRVASPDLGGTMPAFAETAHSG